VSSPITYPLFSKKGLWNKALAQVQVVKLFCAAGEHIRNVQKLERQSSLRGYLAQLQFPDAFALPTDPRRIYFGLALSGCDVLKSRPLRLVLTLRNAEAGQRSVTVLFKQSQSMFAHGFAVGVLRVMDRLWRTRNLDLRLTQYRVQPLAEELGILELLPNMTPTAVWTQRSAAPRSEKTAMRDYYKEEGWWQRERCRQAAVAVLGLHRYQRSRAVLGNGRDVIQFLARSILDTWRRSEWVRPDDFRAVQGEFSSSCAAYAIASCVLGLGDIQNDNIMTSPTGRLAYFEVDRVLGMRGRKFGIGRERPPFVFHLLWRYVIDWDSPDDGGSVFKIGKINLQDSSWRPFTKLMTDAFLALRAEAPLLCSLARVSYIPDEQKVFNTEFVREALRLDLQTEPEATQYMLQLIKDVVKWKSTMLGDAVHLIAHK
jgi:hypothetical protein